MTIGWKSSGLTGETQVVFFSDSILIQNYSGDIRVESGAHYNFVPITFCNFARFVNRRIGSQCLV
jgi:hypothetical protein